MSRYTSPIARQQQDLQEQNIMIWFGVLGDTASRTTGASLDRLIHRATNINNETSHIKKMHLAEPAPMV